MIPYTNRPPENPSGHGLDLVRTPPAKKLVAAFTTPELIGCATHFYGGRTVPCSGDDCAAHADGVPWRWHGYVGAYNPAIDYHFLFEMTAQAAEPIVNWFDQYGTLRGAQFTAVRHGQRANGRVKIQVKSLDLIKYPIPDAPDVPRLLAVIWNLPDRAIENAGKVKGTRAVALNPDTVADLNRQAALESLRDESRPRTTVPGNGSPAHR
jgi:hypothetical protein